MSYVKSIPLLLVILIALLVPLALAYPVSSEGTKIPLYKYKARSLGFTPEIYRVERSYQVDGGKIVDTSGYWSWQDYPFPIPETEPVVVKVIVNREFAAWKPQYAWVVIPEGEWSRILLRVDGRLYDPIYHRPVQYDRVLWIYVNDVPIMWGSTPQRYNWTVTTDVTMFYSLFKGNVTFEVWLPNVVVPSIGVTGRFLVNITLYLFPGEKPKYLPDTIIPLWKRVVIKPGLEKRNTTVTIPSNVTRAMLLLYTKGNGYEEFWYYFGKSYREVKIYFDDKLVALSHPMHTIYTGGMSPFFWRPLPAVRAYAEEPTLIDLTGALPLLVGEHTVSVEVTGMFSRYWQIGAALLLWTTDKVVSYELLEFTSEPSLDVQEKDMGTYTLVEATSTYLLRAKSRLYIGDSVVEATSYFRAEFTALRRYNAVYDNLTISEYRVSKLVYNVVEGDELESFQWSYEWNAPLDVKYFGELEVYGDLSQASVSNPVPGAIVEYIEITQGLRTTTILIDSSGREVKVVDERVRGVLKWSIDLIFISPTGAVVTGIGYTNAHTSKVSHGLIYRIPRKGESYLWNYDRLSVARTYIDSTTRLLYNILADELIVYEV